MSLMDVEIRPEDFLAESRAISNSEVITYLSCRRMYDFAFIMNLAPKQTAMPLERGTLGHGWFEHYIKARLNSSPHEQALKGGNDWLAAQLKAGATIEVVGEAQALVKRYMDYHNGWPEWRLLGTEQRVDLRLSETLVLPIRYDLLVEELATGRRLIGDFKFTYDFWSYNDHSLNPQMPKYISVMRANGFIIDGGFLEQIRTRKITAADKLAQPTKYLWQRTQYRPSNANLINSMRQHVAASLEIEEYRALDEKTRSERSIPILNKYGPCKYCSFADLCISMNEGKKDLSVDIRSGYTQNTYGYNPTAANESLSF